MANREGSFLLWIVSIGVGMDGRALWIGRLLGGIISAWIEVVPSRIKRKETNGE